MPLCHREITKNRKLLLIRDDYESQASNELDGVDTKAVIVMNVLNDSISGSHAVNAGDGRF